MHPHDQGLNPPTRNSRLAPRSESPAFRASRSGRPNSTLSSRRSRMACRPPDRENTLVTEDSRNKSIGCPACPLSEIRVLVITINSGTKLTSQLDARYLSHPRYPSHAAGSWRSPEAQGSCVLPCFGPPETIQPIKQAFACIGAKQDSGSTT